MRKQFEGWILMDDQLQEQYYEGEVRMDMIICINIYSNYKRVKSSFIPKTQAKHLHNHFDLRSVLNKKKTIY